MRKVHIKVEYDAILEEKREGILKSVNELRKIITKQLERIMSKDDVVIEDEEGNNILLLHYKINRYVISIEEVQGDE